MCHKLLSQIIMWNINLDNLFQIPNKSKYATKLNKLVNYIYTVREVITLISNICLEKGSGTKNGILKMER